MTVCYGAHMNTKTRTALCDHCSKTHVAEYHHEGRFGEGPIFIVYCTTMNDDLADFVTTEYLVD